MDLRFISLAALLPYAFRVKEHQIVAPAWVRESMWSVSATLPAGAKPDQAPDMMRNLLVERFKLAFHREKREKQAYTLSVAEGGSTLTAASPDDFQAWDGSFPGFSFRGPLQSGAAITGRIVSGANCSRRYEFVPLPMAALADALTTFLAKPVADNTGMQGSYRVILNLPAEAEAGILVNLIGGRGLPPPPPGGFAGRKGGGGDPDGPRPRPNDIGPGCPEPITLLNDGVGAPDRAIVKAVAALGLNLQAGKAQIDTIVIDRLEKTPTAN
jgi:uncharacterized protein (TIGR03435 family)